MQEKAIAYCCPPVLSFAQPQSTGVIEQSFPTYGKPAPNELLRALSELGARRQVAGGWTVGGGTICSEKASHHHSIYISKGYKTRGSPALTPFT